MIVDIENPKDSTRKLLDLINKFGKVAGYKINIQIFVEFLYIKMNSQKEKLRKNIIYYCDKKRRSLGINLTKWVRDLYLENYRALKKEIEEDKNKWKHRPCSWVRRINIIKKFLLPKAINRFNAIRFKIAMTFFTYLGQKIQKFI